jgi:hypothetical protein
MSIVFLISAAVFFIYFYFSIRKNKNFAFNYAILSRKAKILGIFISVILYIFISQIFVVFGWGEYKRGSIGPSFCGNFN